MTHTFSGAERREFVRLEYVAPLAYKVCKETTLSKLLEGYTVNVSNSGLLCTLKEKVPAGSSLWVSFDRGVLGICTDIEKRCLIYQNGIIGKVVRAEPRKDGEYSVAIRFLTREEKIDTHIYPRVYFGDTAPDNVEPDDAEQDNGEQESVEQADKEEETESEG